MFKSIKNFFRRLREKRELKKALKDMQVMQIPKGEEMSEAQQNELDPRFIASATQIITEVMAPFYAELVQTCGGTQTIEIIISTHDNYHYEISSNVDGSKEHHEYSDPELNYKRVLLAVIKLAEKHGFMGMCCYDKYGWTRYNFHDVM